MHNICDFSHFKLKNTRKNTWYLCDELAHLNISIVYTGKRRKDKVLYLHYNYLS
jgi:hypothetical protein